MKRRGTAISQQRTAAIAALLLGLGVLACGQEIDLGGAKAPAPKGHVSYQSEVVEVAAGKPALVELRFRVDPGFHVNSHTPASDLLIPTELKLDSAMGIKVLGEEYPKGTVFHLAEETLDVYQGEFRVRLSVVVPRGQSTLTGGLRYQACDHAACYPPRTLGIAVAVTGK